MAVVKRIHNKNGTKQVRYQAQVYIKGNRMSYKTFNSKKEAAQWEEQERKFLKWNSSEKREGCFLFSDCINLFEKKAMPFLQTPTQHSYTNTMKYLKYLYSINMKNLNSKHIHNWIDWLKQHPTANNPYRKSFRFELKILSLILNWYKNFVNEDFNVPITKQHKKSCFYKAAPPRRPDYYMRPEEAKKWLRWIKKNREPVYWRIALFMLLTGVRISEACAMKWDAVNLQAGTARVIRIIRWDCRTKRPKLVETVKTSASSRLLMLSDDLIKILERMKKQDSENGFLFKKNTGDPLHYGTIKKSFNKGFKILNLPWRSTHILRHSYATMALIATRDLISVQASLGHRSSRMTERYAKAVALLTKDTAQKTSQIFGLL